MTRLVVGAGRVEPSVSLGFFLGGREDAAWSLLGFAASFGGTVTFTTGPGVVQCRGVAHAWSERVSTCFWDEVGGCCGTGWHVSTCHPCRRAADVYMVQHLHVRGGHVNSLHCSGCF